MKKIVYLWGLKKEGLHGQKRKGRGLPWHL